jgi:hypothetical protein
MDQHHEHHPHRQEGERLDIGQPIFRPDEAGAPQKHESQGRRRYRGVAQAHYGEVSCG